MSQSEFFLIIVMICAIAGIVYLSKKAPARKTKNVYEIVIITSKSHSKSKEEHPKTVDSICVIYEDHEYKAKNTEAYIIPLNGVTKWIHGINEKYLCLFHEYDQKNNPSPRPIQNSKSPSRTAKMLYKVRTYRGLKGAIESQFKDTSRGGLPSWVLVIAVIAVVLAALIMAAKTGIINIPGITPIIKEVIKK